MTLRIISGIARGHRIKLVPGDTTRPIMDRVKEALFSIIGPSIYSASMLDLFAGTGSVGIEALSRGAASVTFCDLARAAVRTIEENLESTKLGDNAQVLQVDAFRFLEQPPQRHYDYIYIAPPQYQELWKQALQALDKNVDWLDQDGVIVVQIDPREDEPLELTRLVEYDRRRYGKTLLVFFERTDAPDAATS